MLLQAKKSKYSLTYQICSYMLYKSSLNLAQEPQKLFFLHFLIEQTLNRILGFLGFYLTFRALVIMYELCMYMYYGYIESDACKKKKCLEVVMFNSRELSNGESSRELSREYSRESSRDIRLLINKKSRTTSSPSRQPV